MHSSAGGAPNLLQDDAHHNDILNSCMLQEVDLPGRMRSSGRRRALLLSRTGRFLGEQQCTGHAMRSCLAGNGVQGHHSVASTSGEARNLERSCKTSSEEKKKKKS